MSAETVTPPKPLWGEHKTTTTLEMADLAAAAQMVAYLATIDEPADDVLSIQIAPTINDAPKMTLTVTTLRTDERN